MDDPLEDIKFWRVEADDQLATNEALRNLLRAALAVIGEQRLKELDTDENLDWSAWDD